MAIARLLHHDCDLLLLDEPTRGIDVASKAEVYKILDDLVTGKYGEPRGVLIVSSYLPELLGVCDRIGVMSQGTLSGFKPTSEWNEQELLAAAIGGGDEDST